MRQTRNLQCQLFAPLCSNYRVVPPSVASSQSHTHTRSSSFKAGSVSPNQPATSSLAINSPPGLLGHLQALGAHLRSAIGRKPAVPWEACSIQDPSTVIHRKQNKQATCALCSALCIQRALLAPVSAGRTPQRPGPVSRNLC